MTSDVEISSIAVVSPDVEGTISALGKFLELKEKVLQKDDAMVIAGKKYIKRSGWRKIALAFNISTEIISVERDYSSNLKIVHVKARATAPNGRVSEEIASCDSTEFDSRVRFSVHNLETKAATRAINRAISNLVGGGEVSAEEITQGNDETPAQDVVSPNADFDADKRGIELASDGQVKFMADLLRQLNLDPDIDSLKKMTKQAAHNKIEELKGKLKEGAKA